MKTKNLILFILLSFSGMMLANADLVITPETSQMIENNIKELNPSFKISEANIEEIANLNLYKIILKNNLEVFYLSKDGNYFFYGDLLDLKQKNLQDRNITDVSKRSIRKAALKKLPENEMIIFKPENNYWGFRKSLGKITVFTDLTCPYGNRLHKEVIQATKSGLEVRYVLFPRGGIDSDGYKKAGSVWCSKNRNKAFALATEGKDLPIKECKNNPIKEHFEFARKIGIQATPSIVLDDGTLVPGYMSSEQLINLVQNSH